MIHTDGKPTIVSDRINAARDERLNRVFGLSTKIEGGHAGSLKTTISDTPTNDGSMEYGAWRVVRELRVGLAEREHIRTKNDVLIVLAELEDKYEALCRAR